MRITYAEFLLGYVMSEHVVTDKLYRKILKMVTDYIETLESRYYFTVYGLLCFLEKLQLELDDDELDKITCSLQEKRYNNLMNLYAQQGMIM